MKEDLILKLVSEVISSINNKEITIQIDDSIETVESWDSLATVTIASAIGAEYGIDLDIDDLEQLTSVKNIIGLIQKN